MADKPDESGHEPNLELPSLFGFGRKKKRKQSAGSGADLTQPSDSSQPIPVADPVATPDDATAAEPATDPLAADPVAEPRGGLAPAAEKPKRLPPVPPPVAAEHDKPATAPPETEQDAEQDPDRDAAQDPDRDAETQVLPSSSQPRPQADPPAAAPAPAAAQAPAVSGRDARATPGAVVSVEEPAPATNQADASVPAARRSTISLPALDPRLAAFLTGIIVGIAGVLLGFLAGRGCEVVRGVGSCGRIGAFALVLILAVQVVLGAALFKAWRFSDPVSTSFLGVGLFAVLVMLFLLGSLTSLLTLLFVPVLSGLTFMLSGWVTSSFGEEGNRG